MHSSNDKNKKLEYIWLYGFRHQFKDMNVGSASSFFVIVVDYLAGYIKRVIVIRSDSVRY